MRIAVGFIGVLWLSELVFGFAPSQVKICNLARRQKAPEALWRRHNIREDALWKEVETFGVSSEAPVQVQSRPMKVTDGIAFIAGTAVGGGFLALPNFTSPIGYAPTVLGLFLAYVFLVLSAIAFVEAAALADTDKRRKSLVDEDVAYSGTSVASIIKIAFGPRWAAIASFGFLAQMLAVMTAQVVKGAELLSDLTGVPYRMACVLPFTCIGAVVYASKSEYVEGFNTILTAVMLGGFAALIAGAFGRGDIFSGLFAKSDWSRLLPTMKAPFAMPIFVKLLAFGEAMPFLVERMAMNSSSSERTLPSQAAYWRVRRATIVGAFLPLLLAIIWAGISAALVDPTNTNPIFSLVSNYGASIGIPVLLLSYGAIGTTLLGSLLAMAHFARDIICSRFGHCSLRWTNIANCLTISLPCLLACIGPSLYIPLLAFAGAYPTTLLYGLAPSLAALTLRRKASRNIDGRVPEAPRLVPGGNQTLVALAVWALGLVGASSLLALRQLSKAVL